jgi:hypothetical protein
MEWTKEETLDYINTSRFFTSFKLNRISGLIADLFSQIHFIDQTDFGIDFTG